VPGSAQPTTSSSSVGELGQLRVAAEAVDQAAARDRGDEHLLRSLRGIETRGALPDVQEDLLDRVRGIVPVRRQTACQRPDQRSELIHALGHRGLIAPGDAYEH
jgi:hypothetical protein